MRRPSSLLALNGTRARAVPTTPARRPPAWRSDRPPPASSPRSGYEPDRARADNALVRDHRPQPRRSTREARRSSLDASLDSLRDQLAAWKKLQETLDDQTKALGERGAELENEAREIDETQKLWNATRTADRRQRRQRPARDPRHVVNDVLAAAADARKRVAARRSRVLSLQTTLNDVGTRIAAGLAKAQAANAEAVKTLLRRRQRAALDPTAASPRPDFFARWRESAGEQWEQFRELCPAALGFVRASTAAIFAVSAGRRCSGCGGAW